MQQQSKQFDTQHHKQQFLKTSPFPLHIPQNMRWGYKEDKNEGN
jgi:hypothetical protein